MGTNDTERIKSQRVKNHSSRKIGSVGYRVQERRTTVAWLREVLKIWGKTWLGWSERKQGWYSPGGGLVSWIIIGGVQKSFPRADGPNRKKMGYWKRLNQKKERWSGRFLCWKTQ